MPDRTLDRRSLLRRGGAVAAGLAGAGAVSALTSPDASAADNDTVKLGAANDANNTAATTTTVTGTNSTAPTVRLASANGAVAPLNVVDRPYPPASTPPDGNVATGDLLSRSGNLYYGVGAGTTGVVLTDWNTPITFGISPVRVVDTRYGSGNVFNPSALDSKGYLRAGQSLYINVTDIGFYPAAVFGNLTAISPLADGYMTLYRYSDPPPNPPNVSALNFTKGGTHGNSFVVAPGPRTGGYLVVICHTSAATQVIFDVTALSDFVSFAGQPGTTSTQGARSQPAAHRPLLSRLRRTR